MCFRSGLASMRDAESSVESRPEAALRADHPCRNQLRFGAMRCGAASKSAGCRPAAFSARTFATTTSHPKSICKPGHKHPPRVRPARNRSAADPDGIFRIGRHPGESSPGTELLSPLRVLHALRKRPAAFTMSFRTPTGSGGPEIQRFITLIGTTGTRAWASLTISQESSARFDAAGSAYTHRRCRRS